MNQRIKKIFDFMEISQRLKRTKRWKGVASMRRKESTANHTWSLTIFCYVVATEFDFEIDLHRALQIALTHDIVEAIADDIASLLIIKGLRSADEKEKKEKEAIKKICSTLPSASGRFIHKLWYEYEKAETPEAKFVKAMDKLESQIHMLNTGSKCFHDPKIMGEYTKSVVLDFPDLLPLNQFIQEKKEEAFGERGWKWDSEYNLDLSGRKSEFDKLTKIYEFMAIAFKLKHTKRYKNTKELKEKDTSAEHSWHVAFLSFIVTLELNLDVDIEKSVKIALVHDLVEALADDTDFSLIAWGIKTPEEKYELEAAAIEQIRETLPEKSGQEIYDLWYEYEKAETKEARYIKALDKIEGIDHMLALGHTCFDHPELIAPYPHNAVKKYPELKGMYVELLDRLKPEFEKKEWPWLANYDPDF